MSLLMLRGYLDSIGPGAIKSSPDLESYLAACWDEFSGSNAEGMKPEKLLGRMESVEWSPPYLTLTIERHGGTVKGSSRADVHRWNLDLDTRQATCTPVGHRQLRPMSPRLDVAAMAGEVAKAILTHQDHASLTWKEDGTVGVQIGRVLPSGSAVGQTLADRRKRFWRFLDTELDGAGWVRLRPGQYGPAHVDHPHRPIDGT